MVKKLLALCLSFCIILCSLPLESATPLNTPAEQAKVLSNSFFDGSTPLATGGSPRVGPSLTEASPVKAPLFLAHNNPALDQACRGIGKGPDCVGHIELKGPKKQDPPTPPQTKGASAACDPSIQDCPAKTSGWSQLWSQAKTNATSFPSSEKEALGQLGKSLAALSIGLLSLFLIIGIPFVAVGVVALASSLLYFTGSLLYGGFEDLLSKIETLRLGKREDSGKGKQEKPLPDVVLIEVPPFEDPSQGITTPIRRKEDLLPKSSPSTREGHIQELAQQNRSLEQEIRTLKAHKERLKPLEGLKPTTFNYANPTLTDTKRYPDDSRVVEGIVQNTSQSQPKPLFSIYSKDSSESTTTRSFLAKREDSTHRGLDIDAPKGSVVTTEQEGSVLYARYHESQTGGSIGNAVVFQVSPTTLTVYQHLGTKKKFKRGPKTGEILGPDDKNSGILVSEGQTIPKGTPLGTVGNTGREKILNQGMKVSRKKLFLMN